jgi:hypothetical protein
MEFVKTSEEIQTSPKDLYIDARLLPFPFFLQTTTIIKNFTTILKRLEQHSFSEISSDDRHTKHTKPSR